MNFYCTRSVGFVFAIVFCIHCLFGVTARQARAELTAEQVRGSLRNGVRFLKEQQESDGSWTIEKGFSNFGAGKTALCTLALLHAGVDPRDPTIVKALDNLAQLDKRDHFTYSVSLQIMVFCMVDTEKYQPEILTLVRWLEKAQRKDGDRTGGWPYAQDRSGGQIDNSNSQFALLALHEAARAGIKVDDQVWGRALNYWKKRQHERSGAFGYINNDNISGTMTCAGISSLIIAHENFQALETTFRDGTVNCCGADNSREEVEKQLQAAHRWLSREFSVKRVPGPRESLGNYYLFYYLYGLERAGRLAGVRFFGEHDWYREGAEFLIETQALAGWWSGRNVEEDKSIATSLALLFLSKGRRPIVVGKYKYGESDDWNRHRKGVHFLTRAVERSWNKDLNWQTVDGTNATVNDLLESPVLFISGSKRITLTQDQKDALREYINQGGFVFAEACEGDGCDGSEFDRSFRELMGELFPASRLEVVGPEHPLWFSDNPIKPNPDRPLLGLQACCRTSVVYCPRNLSCYWNLQPQMNRDVLPAKTGDEVKYCLQLGVNVLAYATNQNLRDKLDRRKIDTKDSRDQNPRDRIVVAKLMHDGGADDAPVALANLMQAARSETAQPFMQREDLISPDDDVIKSHPFLFMHGRRGFKFTEEQRAALRTSLIDRRFFLFADAICGSEAFAEAFRLEMEKMFPDAPLRPIAPDHPLLTDYYGGFRLQSVTLREPHRDRKTGRQTSRETRIAPALEAIEIDGRLVVVFSRHDMSCALENSGTAECKGYSTDDANKIGINILLYALQN